MEVFIRNVPPQSGNPQLKSFLRPHFETLSIKSVEYMNKYGNSRAFLTFLHVEEANRFLQHHGQRQRQPNQTRSTPVDANLYRQLYFLGRPIFCEKAIHDPSPVVIRGLAAEEKQRSIGNTQIYQFKKAVGLPITFPVSSVFCGNLSYDKSELVFVPQFKIKIGGAAKFGKRSLIVSFESGLRMDFLYSAIESITTEIEPRPSFLVSMHQNPRLFQKILPVQDLAQALGLMNLDQHGALPSNENKRRRLAYLSSEHRPIAGNCLVYRIELVHQTVVGRAGMLYNQTGITMSRLERAHEPPPMMQQRTRVSEPMMPLAKSFLDLYTALASINSPFPYPLAFQIQKLAQNNYLPPSTVLGLFEPITKLLLRSGLQVAVATMRKMFNEIPFPSPLVDSHDLELPALIEALSELEEQVLQYSPGKSELFEEESKNRAVIHRARVMPMGTILSGPSPESNNRILRKYPDHHDYFLRVQFSDEDGDQLNFNGRVVTHAILYGVFRDVLENGIFIAGRTFHFLGFSNSSLRMQSAWFVAPFIYMDCLLLDRDIIGSLGDFSAIKSPAKCAARIGQVFSDTRTAVRISTDVVQVIKDIILDEKYNFSDGVGTISRSLLDKIVSELPRARRTHPSCLQIRYRGAKGMVSLDSRLEGDVLCLRPSMVKFHGSDSDDLEICDATYKPLPVYLNRQFIKILEDMGTDDQWFIDLQNDEIDRLRMITDSPLNASIFLKKLSVGDHFNFPELLTGLDILGIDFTQDPFLSNILEVAFLSEIRMLKHRTRIPVPKGYHLHGVLDETGLLEEGQIFCVVLIEGVRTVISGSNLIITRAPALHPGDIQLVEGIVPPRDSPLMMLSNCVCFSQKGSRDLPSQLGGGDLDGDRFYVIFDERALPKYSFPPAAYAKPKPLDIGRTVERQDMTNFFLQYMESDQLGRIAVGHRVLADQREEGTLDRDCLTLAELHSDAVDFSKTGIPPDMSRIPRYRPWRPDFEAPGPHVQVKKLEGLSWKTVEYADPDDIDEDADDDFPNYRYYESDRILGRLYRAIDESSIFEEIQQHRAENQSLTSSNTINTLWYHIQGACKLIEYKHLLDEARDIRDMYEDCLLNVTRDYSLHPRRPLSELEVFAGTILGRNGAQNRHQRELSITMKEKFDEDTYAVVNCIVKNGDQRSDQSLEMSMACLAASLEDETYSTKRGSAREHLLSFKYLAAAVCLGEVRRLHLPIMTGIPLIEG